MRTSIGVGGWVLVRLQSRVPAEDEERREATSASGAVTGCAAARSAGGGSEGGSIERSPERAREGVRAGSRLRPEGGTRLEIAKGEISYRCARQLHPPPRPSFRRGLRGRRNRAIRVRERRRAAGRAKNGAIGRWTVGEVAEKVGIQPPPICGGFSGLAAYVVLEAGGRRRGEKAKLTPMFERTGGFQGRGGKETNEG